MDNLTHSLIGLTASKAGLEKLSPKTTALCLLAANGPDVDIGVLLFSDRWEYLHHHRGITHSIVGSLVLAVALPLAFYLGDLLMSRLRRRAPTVKFKGLLVASLLVTATHPILDWTNNYGMRFLLPWNPRWFYGDFAFVIDPFIWLVLGSASFLLTAKTRKRAIAWAVLALVPTYAVLFGAPGSQMMGKGIPLRILWTVVLIVLVTLHYRNDDRRPVGAKIAIGALAVVIVYCATLAGIHKVAVHKAETHVAQIAGSRSEQVVKFAAMPKLANPLDWQVAMETDHATYRFDISLPGGAMNPNVIRFEKPQDKSANAVAEATKDRRAQRFLEFARFPVAQVNGLDCASQTLVQFADLRYTEPGRGRGTFALDVPVECPSDSTK